MLFSRVSADSTVICIIYFEVILPVTLSLQGFRRKGLIIGKNLVYHLCGEIIFVYRWLGYFHCREVQIKKC